MARGVGKREIYRDERDRELFLTAFDDLREETGCHLIGYCLMENHFHLAIKVADVPLSKIIHRLLTRYALSFNSRYERTGHLFEARYKAIVCANEKYLLRLVHYIHENPVRAHLVKRAIDWPWSSAQTYAGNKRNQLIDPKMLGGLLGHRQQSDLDDFEPWPDENIAEPVLFRGTPKQTPEIQQTADEFAARQLIDPAFLRSLGKRAEHVRVKSVFIHECLQRGFSITQIARWFGCTPAAIHYLAYRKNLKDLKA